MDCYDENKMKLFRELVEEERLLAERIKNKKRHLELRQDILHKLVISVVRNYQETLFSLKFNAEVPLKCFLATEDNLPEKDFDFTALGFTVSYKEISKFEFTPDVNKIGFVTYSVKRETDKGKNNLPSYLSWDINNNGGEWFFNTNNNKLASMPFGSDAVTILLASLSQDD